MFIFSFAKIAALSQAISTSDPVANIVAAYCS